MLEISHSKPLITEEDRNAVDAILTSGMIAEGAIVQQFEKAVSNFLGLSGGITTSCGTGALFLALKALDIGYGDEIILPTYVCRSVWDAVSWTGATPVLCDVRDDWCMNNETVKPQITRATKAIIVVHPFGIVADVQSIRCLEIPLIEDCCQAFGAKNAEDVMAGTVGKLCILSFHATKLLTAGEGGMVLTDDSKLLEKLRSLKYGKLSELVVRYRQPMTDLQAALGLSQLARYESFLNRRRAIADYYFSQLKDLPVRLPYSVRARSIFFRFPLGVRRHFEMVQASFNLEGVQVRRGIDTVLHRQIGIETKNFPGAEKCFAETLSIPIYPALTDENIAHIVDACCRIFKDFSIENAKAL